MTEENIVVKYTRPYIKYFKDNGYSEYQVFGAVLGVVPLGFIGLTGASILCKGKGHICSKDQYNEMSNAYARTSSLNILSHNIPAKLENFPVTNFIKTEGLNFLSIFAADLMVILLLNKIYLYRIASKLAYINFLYLFRRHSSS